MNTKENTTVRLDLQQREARAAQSAASRGDVFKNSLAQNVGNVKTRYSLKDTDNDGRDLTEAQREFFKDSKVLDEDGQLRVVYHGSDRDFTAFDRGIDGKPAQAYNREKKQILEARRDFA